MTPEMASTRPRPSFLALAWPWIVLLVSTVPAIWHFVDFPSDIDEEYPKVIRPTFNVRPPSAYRLAEPGDTIDRVALYASAAILSVAALGWIVGRQAAMWPSVIALGALTFWFSVTPGPCYDGWHGWGLHAIGDPTASIALKAAIVSGFSWLIAVAVASAWRRRDLWHVARDRHASGLLVASAVLVGFRAFDIPGVEPVGYWPRWSFAWGLMAFGFALVRLMPPWPKRSARLVLGLGGSLACGVLIACGIRVTWLHRPLERLHAVVPGKIYISAMPSYEGLKIEQRRLHFKTIVNLFPEETSQRSARLPEELRFVRDEGIFYVPSPGPEGDADAFLKYTLGLAQDPDRWPMLIHCHGCMDRSPAWMGIYRYAVQGRPLLEIYREIEAHRGHRPKATVTLLYNHALPLVAADRHASDPMARKLKEFARDSDDPYGPKKRVAETQGRPSRR